MTDFPPPGGGAPPPPPGRIPPPPPPPPPGSGWGSPGPAQPYGPGPYAYPESSQATTAMTFGIISLAGGLLCGVLILLAPVAWAIGQQEINAIDRGRRDPTKRGQANAGRIMGIVGTVLMVLAIVALIAILIVASSSTSP